MYVWPSWLPPLWFMWVLWSLAFLAWAGFTMSRYLNYRDAMEVASLPTHRRLNIDDNGEWFVSLYDDEKAA